MSSGALLTQRDERDTAPRSQFVNRMPEECYVLPRVASRDLIWYWSVRMIRRLKAFESEEA